MRNIIIALIVIGLLTFGCSGPAQSEIGGPNEAPASSAPAQGAQDSSGSPAKPAETSTSPPEPSPAPDADLSGKNYSGLLMLGKPSVCDVLLHSYEGDRNLRIYFDGSGNMRSEEAATGNSYCPTNIMVYKGDLAIGGTMYTTCPGHTDVLGDEFGTHTPCDWLSMEISSEWGGIGSASHGLNMPDESEFSTPVLDQPAEYNCAPWTVDSSKFELAGYSCE